MTYLCQHADASASAVPCAREQSQYWSSSSARTAVCTGSDPSTTRVVSTLLCTAIKGYIVSLVLIYII